MNSPNRFFQLPFRFDPSLLEKDLQTCLEIKWTGHFNQKDYSGSWTSISLRSASGSENDIYAHHGQYRDTPLLLHCNYFKKIIGLFECEKESIRLMCLAPGSIILEHNDPGAGYDAGFFRVHIPVCTDTGVSFTVDNTVLPMKAGECWYADFQLPHSVRHEGSSPRIHLVLDCLRNEWSDKLFQEAGYDFQEEQRMKEPDDSTKDKIIAELARMNTATASELIKRLADKSSGSR